MNRLKLSFVLIAGIFSVSCATTTTETASAMPSSYEEMITKAETAYAKVDSAGGAWRDTEDLIKQAKKEAAANNMDKAYDLAKSAYNQSVLAQEQLEDQKNAGPWLF